MAQITKIPNSFNDFIISPETSENSNGLIVFLRGGSGQLGILHEDDIQNTIFPTLADNNFFVLITQYGQETDGGGTIDAQYSINLIHEIVNKYNIEESKINIIAHSNGAILISKILEELPNIKTICILAGNSNEKLMLKERDEKYTQARIKLYDVKNKKEVKKRSLISNLKNISKNTRFLLIHSLIDERVNFDQSYKLFLKLKKEGFRLRFLILDNYKHFLIRKNKMISNTLIAWIKENHSA
jgi:dipeptidyl aminopeptidase/acylaminoacyl peptidase